MCIYEYLDVRRIYCIFLVVFTYLESFISCSLIHFMFPYHGARLPCHQSFCPLVQLNPQLIKSNSCWLLNQTELPTHVTFYFIDIFVIVGGVI